ncbi:MAG: hypothetical protein WAM00_05120, partial [Salegentibacter sp.]
MKKIFAALLVLLLPGCQQKSKKKQELTAFIPEKTAIVLQSPDLQEFFRELQKPEILNNNDKIFNGRLLTRISLLSEL